MSRSFLPRLLVRFYLANMFCLPAIGEPLSREERGAPPVTVSQAKGKWIIAGKKQTVTLNASDLALEVHAGSVVWTMVPSGPKDLLVKLRGAEFSLRLADAGKIDITPYDTGFKTGVKIKLNNWRRKDAPQKAAPLDLTLFLTVCLEGKDEDLVFDVVGEEHETVVRRLDWPTAVDGREVDFTVLSNGRGLLLPRTWNKAHYPIRSTNPDGTVKESDSSEVQSNVIESWSMSWWGFQKGKAAMMVIVETPNDAAYQFDHPAGGPTVIGPRWRPTLGKLGYPRSARMCFIPEGNYVELAKRYRRYAMDTGLFVSLAEKIAKKPLVKEIIGTPIVRCGILTNIHPESPSYKKDEPASNRRLTTFDERIKQLRERKEQGFDRLLVVLTGWPRFGYDRQHPDELPPPPEAGGWEGMKRLADACRELGYLFTLHDQYRDYYLDAPFYDPQFAIHEEDATSPPQAFPGTRFGHKKEGVIPMMNHWEGGPQTYLNGRFMLGHLIKNYEALFAHGIHPQGTYLDVFGYVPPDEDFNPEHPTTRTDCLQARAHCYAWSRNNLGIVGTEAGCDWTVPYVDLASPLRSRKGIPVPLFELVYHDAVVIPYGLDDQRGLLNGGSPQISGRQEASKTDLDLVRQRSALHQRVALLEMTKHEFLDDKFRKERTTFADGTTVTADWDLEKVEINPPLAGP